MIERAIPRLKLLKKFQKKYLCDDLFVDFFILNIYYYYIFYIFFGYISEGSRREYCYAICDKIL